MRRPAARRRAAGRRPPARGTAPRRTATTRTAAPRRTATSRTAAARRATAARRTAARCRLAVPRRAAADAGSAAMRLGGRLIRGSVRPDRGSLARFVSLRWAALPIIDRRWTAPMAAGALGFGLFVGVAIGPGTQGTAGTTRPATVEVPATPPPTDTASVPGDGDGGGGQTGPSGADGGAPTPTPPPLDAPSPPPPVSTPSTTPPITSPPVTPIAPTTTTSTTTTTETTEEQPTPLSGTVVHINPEAASYTIVDEGSLVAIHSHRPPDLGKSIEVDALRLANGTYVEDAKREEHGNHGQATFEGTVSFSDGPDRIYTVSAPGVSLLVRGTAGRRPPAVGDAVEVRVRIADNPEPLRVRPAGENGCGRPPALPKPPKTALEQVSLRIEDGEPASVTSIEAVIEGVCRDKRKLVASADDVRASGRDIGLAVPKEINLGRLEPGQVVKLSAEIFEGGSMRVSTIAGDKGGEGADDPDLVQP